MSSTPIDAASIAKQLAEAREKKAMLEDKIKQTQLFINNKMNAIAEIDAKQQKMESAVCLQPFNATRRSPIILHCGHSFCSECIACMVTAKGKNTPLIPFVLLCPTCRDPNRGISYPFRIEQFRVNMIVRDNIND